MHVAHIRNDHTEQSVADHLTQTADLCERYGRKISMPNMARLGALLHDIGKLTAQFDAYIHDSAERPEDRSVRGKIPHAIQGAKYLVDHFAAASATARTTAHMLAGLYAQSAPGEAVRRLLYK